MKLWLYSLLVALLVAGVCSQPEMRRLPKPDDVVNILWYLKRHAHEIDPLLGLGPLDPLKFASAALNIIDEEIQVEGLMENVEVTGVRELEFETPIIQKIFYYSLSLRLPSVKLQGNYSLDGIIGNDSPLYGRGRFNIDVTDLRILAELKFNIDGGFVYVQEANVTLGVEFVKVKVNFENLLGGGETGDIMNDIISEMIPTLLKRRMGQILDLLENKVIKDGFKILFPEISLFDFQKLITETDWKI